MKRVVISAIAVIVFSFASIAQDANSKIPDWLQQEWENQTRGSGTWIADNSEYKSDNETYDAYGLQWQYGIGKKSITGRLFVIKEEQDLGTVWEFRVFWNPKEKRAVIQQFGSDGTYGEGQITSPEEGKYQTEEVFATPSGEVYSSGHKKEYVNSSISKVTSFSVDEEGKWSENRTYLWKLRVD